MVYDACLNSTPGDRDGPRKLLEIRPIWGNRGTVGAQTILRIPNGSFDIELLETIIAIDPPLHFAADQKPLRYLEYDPAERLPPLDIDTRPADRAFRHDFGKEIPVRRFDLTLAPRQGGCDLSLSLSGPKPGRLLQRRWIKQTEKLCSALVDDIERQLAVAAP